MPDSLPATIGELDASERAPRPRAVDWRSLFSNASPSAILARLVDDDPLRLRPRVASALREAAYFVEGDRVELRVLARVARAAPRYDGRPDFDAWLAALLRESIEEIVRDDLESEAPCADGSSAFTQLTKPLGLDAAAMGRACAAFNRLVVAERRAFFDLVIEGRTLDEVCRASGDPATDVARRARRALDAILNICGADAGARVAAVAETKEEGP